MNQIALDLQPADQVYRIPLTQGQFALVDKEDFDRVSEFKWFAHYDPKTNAFTAKRAYWTGGTSRLNGGVMTTVPMPNFILEQPSGIRIDHKNHNTLDNTRSNLRPVTHMQNCWNRRRKSDNTSGFKGVSLAPIDRRLKNPNSVVPRKWRARIMVAGKRKLIGNFSTAEQAHQAYMEAAKELHGEFAAFN